MKTSPAWSLRVFGLAVVFTTLSILLSGAPEERRISFYSTAANYSLPLVERDNKDYVGLLEVLEPLGSVAAKVKGNHWRIRYNDVEVEFTAGKTNTRIRGNEVNLSANFLLENGRGLVPVLGVNSLLAAILGGPVTLNPTARRVFIGNVAIHFTAQVSKTAPTALVMNFTSPVNPTIATEPGKLRMTFNRDAVVAPGSQTLTFDSKVTPSAIFQESNGSAEVVVNNTAPVIATFSNGGRTITIGMPSGPQGQGHQPQPPPLPTETPSPTPAANPSARKYFVVVDAAHGGDERGAALTDQLAEKDVTLSLARRLQQDLEAHGLPALLLRDSDVALSPDQRASSANSSGAAIYICLHVSSEGAGIRLYTALVPASSPDRGPFLSWNSAQNPFQPLSQEAESEMASALRSKQVPVRSLTAPLRPLNNITAAAVALELAPSTSELSQLTSPDYQQLTMSTIASAIANMRERLAGSQK